MKLSLVTAGLVAVTSALALVQAHSLIASFSAQPISTAVGSVITPANAATNPHTEVATTNIGLPARLAVPPQIGGQAMTPNAQEGISCLISKNNDKDACGEMALKREIAKCLAGIGVHGGCFDFFNKPATAVQTKPAKTTHEARRSKASSPNYRRASHELRMLTRNWF